MKRTIGWIGLASCAALLGPALADSQELPPPPSWPGQIDAPPSECRVLDLEMQPTEELQIVAWLEDAAGNYVDTIYITQATGSYGLGNRPGVFGMRSSPGWPYGPRDDVFPVWSHRHGMMWRRVRFQNGDGDPGGPITCDDVPCKSDTDRNLSHPFTESSEELHFGRPLNPSLPEWDAGTGASAAFTDKGTMLPADGKPQFYSLYPPRDDVEYNPERDRPDVLDYDTENPFDAVSQATPAAGVPYRYSWLIPPELFTGTATDYVLFVEVSKEYDANATFNPSTLPTASASGWNDYGLPYRGQPSVVYRLPFQIGPEESRVSTSEIAGFGDPLAADGVIRPNDAAQITTDTPGSGALRLDVVHDAAHGEDYQVRVDARFEIDQQAPGSAGPLDVVTTESTRATIELTAPGDDGMVGHAAGFDIRYRANEPITYGNFGSSPRLIAVPDPELAGERQQITLTGLLPSTRYYVAVRAYDSCRNYGALDVTELDTPDRAAGEVDACFIATAAYGSVLANDVVMLRRFRDAIMRSNAVGELAVETYYTFSPAIAQVIGQSELLRETVRAALGPVVDEVRTATVPEL